VIDLGALHLEELAILLSAFAWLLGAGGGIAFFVTHGDAALKRRLWPWAILLATATFVALALWASGPSAELAPLLLVGAAGLAAFGWRAAQFCARCGATVFNANPIERARFCPRCAARLSSGAG
jgi:fatty acid desaturase